ncbi:sulfite exporter TauE/SafE family protein [Pseudothauera nasutitermitis]|uniref:Probable membrane transporter protein n=1 Tax=Pseudothauera nasutitermitis TaxID=2565930 RepID=A0A4S4AXT8_9RHOO|nr:sulfite exporter TauE/SafE family protein [Pseudothauera nasutitermitis]THF64922.1 sulfite exporter TauE/SafE family protein [Pseudothauera nasutitermitis]
MDAESSWLAIAFLVIALAYAAVGQAGASGYIAAMAFVGLVPLVMKMTALALNLLVAAIGTFYFLKAGRLSWRNVYPFAILGFPFSLLGGAVHLPEGLYYPAVGVVLVLSAIQMARSAFGKGRALVVAPVAPPFRAALATGAIIGFISGTTGTGGGVFLAAVILAMNWGTPRQTAATTAVYNLINSAAALVGAYGAWHRLPESLPWWLAAVAVGGALGAFVGSRYLSDRWLRAVLAILLLVSGLNLLR